MKITPPANVASRKYAIQLSGWNFQLDENGNVLYFPTFEAATKVATAVNGQPIPIAY